jgi:rRNA maturation endonuclease Nob1
VWCEVALVCFSCRLGYVLSEGGCAEEIQPESIEKEKMMRTTIAKGCLYCGLRLPEHADYCPECGRPVEKVAIRVGDEDKMMRTTHTKMCLFCGFRFPDSVDFCSKCGRQLKEAA